MKKLIVSLLLGASCALSVPSAALATETAVPQASKPTTSARAFSALYVFGGPLEDNGNYASVYGDLPAPFYKNHFTNGPDAVDHLAANLGFTLKPSLHRVGPVKGNNFASADALAFGSEPKDLQGQISAFLDSRGGQADAKALYYVIIGGNDVISATFEPDNEKSKRIVDQAIESKRQAIHRLVKSGVKTLFFDNFTNIGLTPKIRLAGLSARGEWISRYHNQQLDRMFSGVEAQYGNRLHLIRFDFWQFTANDLIASANPLGFTNTTDACLSSADCDLDKFVFINDLFLSAKVHKIWGELLTTTLMRGLYCKENPTNTYCVAQKLVERIRKW
jgi:phospholipase/lecithinase/hemolysin